MRRLVTSLAAALSAVIWPTYAYADNCGSLSDCFYTLAAALAVVAAVAIVIAILLGLGGGGGLLALAGGGTLDAAAAAWANAAIAAAAAAAAAAGAGTISLMASEGTPGNNQAQNRQFRDAVQEAERQLEKKLTPDQVRRIHDEISGENMNYQELVEHIISMFQ